MRRASAQSPTAIGHVIREASQRVDLNEQYRKIRWHVNREIKKVIKSSSFINGPSVKEFQDNLQNFLGIRHVIPCANGTDALQVALMSLELNKGDKE